LSEGLTGSPQPVTDAPCKEFEPEPASLSSVRQFLRTCLLDLGTDAAQQDLADSLVTAANELATNAVIHGRTEFSVTVLIDERTVRIEVADANPRMPQPCHAPSGAISGRGLQIVDAVGLAWGADRYRDGKTVWLEADR
jgi:anti-sigma regulatory factor (Ser/Thr protein kinase)